jgi:FKBP-type peptidyl-prolyl cis-trans isomerase (trigger factor)
LGAQVDELGSYVLDQQRRQVDEEIQARERRAQLMSQLRDVANAPIPPAMSRQERAEFLDQLDREAAQREQAEQDSLARETDQAESRRLWAYEDRQR